MNQLDMNVLIAEMQQQLAFAKSEVTQVRLSACISFHFVGSMLNVHY